MPETGRNWIFIRGLGRHKIHWQAFSEEFQRHFPNDEIEFLDLRGNGTLAHSPSLLSIEENVRDLRARSIALHQGKPVYLLSISLGAMVGVEWAHAHPQEIAGLVAINTSDRGSSSFFQRLRPLNYHKLLWFFISKNDGEHLEKIILEATVHKPELQKKWAEIYSRTPPTSRKNFLRQLVAASTYQFPPHKPKTEILLMGSEADRLVSSQCTQNIAEMWTLTPHLHPSAGHDLPLEEPVWVCEQIQRWLKFSRI